MALVVGFSGSSIVNSNLDFVIQEILVATGLETEFIKLSRYHLRPCLACLKCAATNRCVQQDGMNEILAKVEAARGIVIGGFPTFFSLNALTKTFLERLYPLKHRVMLTQGKFGIAVAGGFRDATRVEEYLRYFFNWYRMNLVGSIQVPGNAPCLSCGYGEECAYSNVPLYYGSHAIKPEMFCRAGDNERLVARARELGRELGRRIGESTGES
ncbi:NADPH-dependent FMN reductase [Neomoorella glycerini]|uniref:NADPH-dependent FMN reductase n=1 Tax=Neomoorella glycerini TaxID=55779 RepID=A0A6I5ZPM7_9FIRM|nr:flavodoxin family protein [Moorella glycerini]QGP91567.1 NADPH-dependent FMN reductase [Moorella glycerini]